MEATEINRLNCRRERSNRVSILDTIEQDELVDDMDKSIVEVNLHMKFHVTCILVSKLNR